jgi:hypothetical protein
LPTLELRHSQADGGMVPIARAGWERVKGRLPWSARTLSVGAA